MDGMWILGSYGTHFFGKANMGGSGDYVMVKINMSKLFVGIDNGLNGGICVIDGDFGIVAKVVMPTIAGKGSKREYNLTAIKDFFTLYENDITLVVLERAQAFPGQGVSSMFRIGLGFGILQGLLAGMNIRYQIIHPKTWQKVVLQDMNREDTKQASALYAQRMNPGYDWRATDRSKNIHDGLTDAYCMAVYAKKIAD